MHGINCTCWDCAWERIAEFAEGIRKPRIAEVSESELTGIQRHWLEQDEPEIAEGDRVMLHGWGVAW